MTRPGQDSGDGNVHPTGGPVPGVGVGVGQRVGVGQQGEQCGRAEQGEQRQQAGDVHVHPTSSPQRQARVSRRRQHEALVAVFRYLLTVHDLLDWSPRWVPRRPPLTSRLPGDRDRSTGKFGEAEISSEARGQSRRERGG